MVKATHGGLPSNRILYKLPLKRSGASPATE
jgi:hypothetical protein